jgi:hypothetical protein
MRLRNRRKRRPEPESSHLAVAGSVEVDSLPPVTWSIEQLNSLGPMTGPSHRTFVPIVRSTMAESSLGDPTESSAPRLQP